MGDGGTEAEHKASAAGQWKKLGRRDLAERAEPENPHECPRDLFYLMRWLYEIAVGLPATGMACPVVSWSELQAWCGQMRLALEPWEARALVRLGNLRAAVHSEKSTSDGTKHQN